MFGLLGNRGDGGRISGFDYEDLGYVFEVFVVRTDFRDLFWDLLGDRRVLSRSGSLVVMITPGSIFTLVFVVFVLRVFRRPASLLSAYKTYLFLRGIPARGSSWVMWLIAGITVARAIVGVLFTP